jgi:hypothetical protein
VRAVFNFPAAQAFIATINRRVLNFNWPLAIKSFCQRTRNQFQFIKPLAGEQVGMAKPPAGERALQQPDA